MYFLAFSGPKYCLEFFSNIHELDLSKCTKSNFSESRNTNGELNYFTKEVR